MAEQSVPVADPLARSKPWILAATVIGASMSYIDSTVVNVAMPVLQREFGARLDAVQWVVEAYTLFVAALVLVGGSLGDRYGRRRIYATGITLYAVASGWCALAPDIGQLIAARALQGIGGALLIPGSLAIITAAFEERERGKAIGTWSGLSAVSTAIGPLLGGWLVDAVSWRAVFLINIPMAAIVLLLLARHVPESRDDEAPARLDWTGAVVVALGLAAFTYGLIGAGAHGFTGLGVLGPLIGGAALFVLFIVIERRVHSPMLPLALFRSRIFSGANLLTLFLYAALSCMFFFMGFNLVQVQKYSATATGAAFLPFIIFLSVLSRWSGGLATRYGPRLPLVAGPLTSGAGFALLAFAGVGGTYWTSFFPGICVVGLGMALTVAPLTSTVMNAGGARHAGAASGINNAVSWLSGLLGIAALGIVAVGVFSGELDQRLAAAPITPELRAELMAQRTKLAAITIPATATRAEYAVADASIGLAYAEAFKVVLLTCAGLAIFAALVSAMTIGSKKESAEITDARTSPQAPPALRWCPPNPPPTSAD